MIITENERMKDLKAAADACRRVCDWAAEKDNATLARACDDVMYDLAVLVTMVMAQDIRERVGDGGAGDAEGTDGEAGQ